MRQVAGIPTNPVLRKGSAPVLYLVYIMALFGSDTIAKINRLSDAMKAVEEKKVRLARKDAELQEYMNEINNLEWFDRKWEVREYLRFISDKGE